MDTCAGIGPLVAVVTSTLKVLPWVGPLVRSHPKLVAAALAAMATFVAGAFDPSDLTDWLVCVLRVFAEAVATYEVALKPVSRAMRA